MQTFEAKRTKAGALFIATDPMTARDLVGELVQLLAPDGSTAAYGRVRSTGRTYTTPDGRDAAYAYLDPQTLMPAGAA